MMIANYKPDDNVNNNNDDDDEMVIFNVISIEKKNVI